MASYQKLLKPYGISVVNQSQTLSTLPMVEVQLHIAQIKTHFLRQWGVQWPEKISGQILSGKNFQLSAFELSLQSLESQGQGQVLASPTLVSQSGEKARFHSGGEFPIKAIGQFSQTVQWKSYGVLLELLPEATAKGHLKLKIQAELSAIDQSHTEGGTPGLLKNQMETTVQMKELRPIVISGLIRKEWGRDSQGLPWLRQIPVLSPLFSTSNQMDKQGELVMILVPRLIWN